MATVRKRNWTTAKGEQKEAWIVDYKDGLGKRRFQQFERKKDADAHRRQVEDELSRGVHTHNRDSLLFREVVGLPTSKGEEAAHFFAECQWRNRVSDRMSDSRLDRIRDSLRNHLLPAFGQLKVNKITSEIVQDWINKKVEQKTKRTGKPYKTKTVGQFIVDLNMVLDHAVAKNLGLKRNPLKDVAVRLPKREEEPVKFLEVQDVARLLRWVVTGHRATSEWTNTWRISKLVVMIAMFAGLRRGEVCALDWQRVKVDEWMIDVHYSLDERRRLKGIKTGSRGRRTVPMNPILHAFLEDHWERCGRPESGPVIVNEHGRMIAPNTITSHYWPHTCARVGLVDGAGERPYSFHDLRHAAGSFWLADGMPLEEVSRLLGHTRLDTTWNVYIHKLQHDQRALQAIEHVSNRFVHLMAASGVQLPASQASQRPLQLAPPAPAPTMIDVTPETANGAAKHPEMPAWQRRAIELYKDGVTIVVIANDVGHCKRKVSKFLESTGMYRRPPRAGWRKLPEEDRERALAMFRAGMSAPEIAAEFGVAEGTLRRWAEDEGIIRPHLRPGPKTPRTFYRFSDEVRERALAMWAEGRSSSDIAAELGTTPGAILRWARLAGMPRRGAGWKSEVGHGRLRKQSA